MDPLPDFRFVLKKNAPIAKSNVLQAMVNKTITADFAKSPYTLEMEQSGIKVKAIKKSTPKLTQRAVMIKDFTGR